jgi:hypothetical protein
MTRAGSVSVARVTQLLPRRSDWAHARPGRDQTAGLEIIGRSLGL